MGWKCSIESTVAFSKSLYLKSHKKYHSLLGISEKAHIKVRFQKTEFDKYNTSGVKTFSITSYLFNPIHHGPKLSWQVLKAES